MRRAAAFFLLICSFTCLLAAKKETPPPPAEDLVNPVHVYMYPRPVETWLDVQIALARQAISCGSIDGVGGHQTALGLTAFQERAGIDTTGKLDNATRARLLLTSHPFKQIALTAEDLASLHPLSKTWLGKSQQTSLAFETALELLAERTHSHPKLLQRLNPGVNWSNFGWE